MAAKCTACGAELSGGEKFCPKCGAPVSAAETPAPAPQSPETDEAAKVQETEEVQKTQETQEAQEPEEKESLFWTICVLLRVWGGGLCFIGASVTPFSHGYIWHGIVMVIAAIAWIVIGHFPLKFLARFASYSCVILAIFYAFSPITKDEAYIDGVRDTTPTYVDSHTSLKRAFDDMFESGKWSCDRKAKTVEYEGKYERDGYGGGADDVKIIFTVDEDEGTYQITQFYVDGVLLEEVYANILIYVAFQIDDVDIIDRQLSLNDLAHTADVWYSELQGLSGRHSLRGV